MTSVAVALSDIEDGVDWASLGGYGESQAWLCRASGKVHYHTETGDNFEELPDNIDDEDKYVLLPGKRDLDLGRALAERFAAEHVSDAYDKVRELFSRRGAFARFKDLLERRDKLQQWYDYERNATYDALRQWCEANEITWKD